MLWNEKYCYDIPVFHLDGKYLMKHKANLSLLHRKLMESVNQEAT